MTLKVGDRVRVVDKEGYILEDDELEGFILEIIPKKYKGDSCIFDVVLDNYFTEHLEEDRALLFSEAALELIND